jgi:hypothetical protein
MWINNNRLAASAIGGVIRSTRFSQDPYVPILSECCKQIGLKIAETALPLIVKSFPKDKENLVGLGVMFCGYIGSYALTRSIAHSFGKSFTFHEYMLYGSITSGTEKLFSVVGLNFNTPAAL